MRSERRHEGVVEARVLGPITVLGRSGPIEPGGHKLRLLLALLISRLGQVVTTDQLIDGLWGEEPPASARKSLQVHVSNLRRNLGKGFPLRTVAGGYTIDATGIDVDAVSFERDVESARQLAGSDPLEARRLLTGALARWIGPAYADVAREPSMRAEATRLDELRIRALEQRIDAELELGQHDEVLGELQTLAIEHPSHERFRLQHMLALYRAGRQADALHVYRRTREMLVEELGVDPSPELVQMHQAILMQAPELDAIPPTRTDPTDSPHEGSVRGYELREPVAAGRWGAVYRAYQASVAREVALEEIGPELANDREFIERFEVECQIVARLEHPHIAPLLDYWRGPDGAYLVTPWLRGGTVATTFGRGPWRPSVALRLVEQVGAALEHAHSRGVVHGDLQPDDVLLDEDGNGYVSHFGTGRHGISARRSGWDASYRAPEVLAGDEPGRSGDVYAMALLTFELLTNDRPPMGGRPSPVEGVRGDMPVGFDDLMARATDPEPGRRLACVDDYLSELQVLFEGDERATAPSSANTPVRNPYKGLRAFGEADVDDFFGREQLLAELVVHVRENRLTLVVGPSGCGKSSLVRAGLIAHVRAGDLDTAGAVVVTEMFPGSHPFEELEAALLRVACARPAGMFADLTADAHGLSRVTKQILPGDDTELLLVVDQFEELFLQTAHRVARERFMDSLAAVAADRRSRVRLVLALRADYLDRPLVHREFGGLLRSRIFTVVTPSEEELATVISGPAGNAGLVLESGLVPTILRDVPVGSAALPMLEYALTELVDSSPGGRLTIDGYERTGGVVGALSRRAETIYEDLTPADRETAREIFLRLVAVHEEGDDTRRRVRRTELAELGFGEDRVTAVIGAFGGYRLLTLDRDPVTRGPTVEVAHEALLREWPRYRAWIDGRREDLLLERRLERAVAEWVAHHRDESLLFRSGHLERYETWAATDTVRLTGDERAFLFESRRVEDAERAASARRRRGAIGVLSVMVLLASVLALVAMVQRDRADEHRLEAEANARLAAAQRMASHSLNVEGEELALALAVEAGDLLASSEGSDATVASALYQAVLGQLTVRSFSDVDFATSVSPTSRAVSQWWSGDGAELIMGDGPERFAIVDFESWEERVEVDVGEEYVWVWWDHENDAILTSNREGVVRWWDPEDGRELDARAVGEDWVFPLARVGGDLVVMESPIRMEVPVNVFATDIDSGRRVFDAPLEQSIGLSSSGDHYAVWEKPGVVRVYRTDDWNEVGTITMQRPAPYGAGYVSVLIPSEWVAGEEELWLIDEDGSLVRVDVVTGVIRHRFDLDGPPELLAAHPGGNLLAVLFRDDSIQLLDTENGAVVETLPAPFDVEWLMWTPDGGRLGALGLDDMIAWDISMSTVAPRSIWPPTVALPTESTELVDGTVVFAMSGGGSVVTEVGGATRWSLPSRAEQGSRAVVSGDGSTIVLPADNGVEVRNTSNGEVRAVSSQGLVRPLGVSADGTTAVVATSRDSSVGEHSIALLDTTTGAVIGSLGDFLVGEQAAYIADGSVALVALERVNIEGKLSPSILWAVDAATGEALAAGPEEPCITALSVGPDDEFVAVGGCDGTISLYEFDTLLGEQPWTARIGQTPPGSAVAGLAFDAARETIVASHADGRVAAWSLGEVMTEQWSFDVGGEVGVPRVTGDDVWLGLIDQLRPADQPRGGVIGLPLDDSELLDFARLRMPRDLTDDECRRYLGGPCGTR